MDNKIYNRISKLRMANTIAFIGNTNAGKSSIINKLIGKKILPVNHNVETFKQVRICHNISVPSDKLTIEIQNENIIHEDNIYDEIKRINKDIQVHKKESLYYDSKILLETQIDKSNIICNDIDAIDIYDTKGFSDDTENWPTDDITEIIKISKIIYIVVGLCDFDKDETKQGWIKIMNILNEYNDDCKVCMIINKIDDLEEDDKKNIYELKKDYMVKLKNNGIDIDMNDLIFVSTRTNEYFIDFLMNFRNYVEETKKNVALNNMIEILTIYDSFFKIYDDNVNYKIPYSIQKELINSNKNNINAVLNIGSITLGIGALLGGLLMGIGVIAATAVPPMVRLLIACSAVGSISWSMNNFSGYNLYKLQDVQDTNFYKNNINKIYKDKIIAKDNKHIIYNGDFLGLNYHGYGRLNYPDNTPFIEGMFQNGIINGPVKIYDVNRQVIYDGEIIQTDNEYHIIGVFRAYENNVLRWVTQIEF